MDNFEFVLRRLYQATDIKSQRQLADVLKIRPPSVTDAKKRGVVPPDWVVKLSLYYNLSPAWLLSGKKPVYIEPENSYLFTQKGLLSFDSTMESNSCRHKPHCSRIEEMPMGHELLSDFFGLVDGYPREFTIAMAEIFKLTDEIRRKTAAADIVDNKVNAEGNDQLMSSDLISLDYFSFLAGFELQDSRFFQTLQPAIENADFSMLDTFPMAVGLVSVEEKELIYSNKALLDLTGFSMEEARQYVAKSFLKVELPDRPHRFLTLNNMHFSSNKQPIDINVYLGQMFLQCKTEVIVGALKPVGVSLYDGQN